MALMAVLAYIGSTGVPRLRGGRLLAIDRLVPTDEGAELIGLVREIAPRELAPPGRGGRGRR